MDKDDNNKKNKDQANDRVIDDKLLAADLEYEIEDCDGKVVFVGSIWLWKHELY